MGILDKKDDRKSIKKKTKKVKKGVLFFIGAVFVGVFVYQTIKVVVLENEKTVVSVLVLKPISDQKTFEKEVRGQVKIKKGQKVLIQSIDAEIEANHAIATTWIRAKTADVIVGEEKVIRKYAEAGYLKELSEKDRIPQKHRYYCALAEYNTGENIEKIGEEKWLGVFAKEIPGLDEERLVVSLAANVVNEENALELLRAWGE